MLYNEQDFMVINIEKSWDAAAQSWKDRMDDLYAANDIVWGPFGPSERKLRLLPQLKGKRVLVAGCGSGPDVCYLADEGASVFGIDLSSEQLTLAKQRLTSRGLRADLEKVDLNQKSELQLKPNLFDLVVSNYALQYVKDLKVFFREVTRILKPGGSVVFSHDHPILYAHYPAVQGRERNTDGGVFFDYFTERRLTWLFSVSEKDIKAYSYHRTLSSIVEALVQNNLQIEVILEPKPDHGSVHHYTKKREIAKRIPYTLIIKAKKAKN